MKAAPHLLRGQAAERYALAWLQRQRLKLVHSNYSCRYGELDLVMLDQHCLAVIEVRYRNRSDYGGPLASVTRSKQQKICRATARFLQQHRQYCQHPLRFDVIALTQDKGGIAVDWRKQAFEFSGH